MTDLDRHLSGIAAADTGAFGRWMSAAEPHLRAALRPFAARVDGEAVLQEVFLRVWQVAPRVRPDGRPNALLRVAHVTARNLALSELRRQRVATMEAEALARAADAAEVAAHADPDPLLRAALDDCEQRLPPKARAALHARLASEGAEPDRVLAERLGMRPNTFLQNLTRARRHLAECLERRGIHVAEHLAT